MKGRWILVNPVKTCTKTFKSRTPRMTISETVPFVTQSFKQETCWKTRFRAFMCHVETIKNMRSKAISATFVGRGSKEIGVWTFIWGSRLAQGTICATPVTPHVSLCRRQGTTRWTSTWRWKKPSRAPSVTRALRKKQFWSRTPPCRSGRNNTTVWQEVRISFSVSEPPAQPWRKEGVYLHLLQQDFHSEVAPTTPHEDTHRLEDPHRPGLSKHFHRAGWRERAHTGSQQRHPLPHRRPGQPGLAQGHQGHQGHQGPQGQKAGPGSASASSRRLKFVFS